MPAVPKPIAETKEQRKARQLKHAYDHKLEKAKERIEKLKTKVKKKPNESLSLIKKRVQKLINEYVRLRDTGLPCISCQKPIIGQAHAGHYCSQGMHGVLRYDLDNIHAQCVNCNVWKRGNLIEYRMNLVKKVGLARVENLEANMHAIHKWTRDELLEIERMTRIMINATKSDRLRGL